MKFAECPKCRKYLRCVNVHDITGEKGYAAWCAYCDWHESTTFGPKEVDLMARINDALQKVKAADKTTEPPKEG